MIMYFWYHNRGWACGYVYGKDLDDCKVVLTKLGIMSPAIVIGEVSVESLFHSHNHAMPELPGR